ncbi:helix-turn-helix transcriptional regulator [Natronobiforma cellulositropha]|uniref:helix-turn-helix transcriptional regulator n=1 Tax=Natronobiforma cellulositropha TaxID=1679076 RepID=UPI0021D56EF4|nr:transcriptional regulator [Natronobiforma cellulositropha]
MSPQSSDLGVLETLSRRYPVLSRLETGPKRKRDLVDALSVSRSTVDRAIRELEYFEFVDRCDGVYRLTAAGRLALAEHRERLDALASITDVSEHLRWLSRDAPMSVDFLAEATVFEPKSHAPNEPFEVIVDRTDDAECIRGLMAAERVPHFRTRICERTATDDLTAELVFTAELAGFFLETCASQLREAVASGRCSLYETRSLPYGLWIVETASREEAFVVVHGDSADVRAVFRNDSPDALEWASGVYERIRDRADPLALD